MFFASFTFWERYNPVRPGNPNPNFKSQLAWLKDNHFKFVLQTKPYESMNFSKGIILFRFIFLTLLINITDVLILREHPIVQDKFNGDLVKFSEFLQVVPGTNY